MTKNKIILLLLLLMMAACSVAGCIKWNRKGEIAFFASVKINDKTYSDGAKYYLTGKKECLFSKHRNDSSFFYFFINHVNPETARSSYIFVYLVEPTSTSRPVNGKTYEFKKGMQYRINDKLQWQYFDDWSVTDNCIYLDFEGENSRLVTIRDGSLTYTEQGHKINCEFNAILELEDGDLLNLTDGKIYINN